MSDKKASYKLTSPVTIGEADPITSLNFREPTGEDLADLGNPVDLDVMSEAKGIRFNKSMVPMIARLGNVPQVVVKKMTAKDVTSISWLLVPFFLPDASALSSLATSLQSVTGNTP